MTFLLRIDTLHCMYSRRATQMQNLCLCRALATLHHTTPTLGVLSCAGNHLVEVVHFFLRLIHACSTPYSISPSRFLLRTAPGSKS